MTYVCIDYYIFSDDQSDYSVNIYISNILSPLLLLSEYGLKSPLPPNNSSNCLKASGQHDEARAMLPIFIWTDFVNSSVSIWQCTCLVLMFWLLGKYSLLGTECNSFTWELMVLKCQWIECTGGHGSNKVVLCVIICSDRLSVTLEKYSGRGTGEVVLDSSHKFQP